VSKHNIYDIVQVLIFKRTLISVISVELSDTLSWNESVKRFVMRRFWPSSISLQALSFHSLQIIVWLSSVSVTSRLSSCDLSLSHLPKILILSSVMRPDSL